MSLVLSKINILLYFIIVVQYSAVDLYEGFFHHSFPTLEVSMSLYIILGVGIVLKFALWVYCIRLNETAKSDMLDALAEDHLNDVISNTAAIVTAAVAFNTPYWWMDPGGAILISVIIISRWISIIYEQVKKIVGHTAPQEFMDQVPILPTVLFVFLFLITKFGSILADKRTGRKASLKH